MNFSRISKIINVSAPIVLFSLSVALAYTGMIQKAIYAAVLAIFCEIFMTSLYGKDKYDKSSGENQ